MKFYSNQVLEVADQMQKSGIAAALIYGPDHGLIDFSLNQIAKRMNLPKRTISYAEASYSGLKSELNNASLFGTKEIIRLTDISTFDAKLKELVVSDNHNFLIITAEELAPSSGLRKMFEAEKNLASIACYHDDATSIQKIVQKYCLDAKKHISPDALKYLSNGLYGDRYLIINEVEKLFTYLGNRVGITLEDVEKVMSGSTTTEPDLLCIYFFKKDYKFYIEELHKLLAENISAVWIIRALIRYGINIYITLQKMSDGMSLDDGANSLSPPIFFKYMPDFKRIITQISQKQILKILENLYHAEVSLKSSILDDKLICEGLLISIPKLNCTNEI